MKVGIFDVDTFIAAPKFGFVAGTTSPQLETRFTALLQSRGELVHALQQLL
jgi:hypothetical protein